MLPWGWEWHSVCYACESPWVQPLAPYTDKKRHHRLHLAITVLRKVRVYFLISSVFFNLHSSEVLKFPINSFISKCTLSYWNPRNRWKATVLSFRLSAADSLKETPFRKCDPICTGTVGSSHCMGCGGVCLRPVCWASASLQQPW